MGVYNFLCGPGKSERLSYIDLPVEVNELHDKNGLLGYPWGPFSTLRQRRIQAEFPMSNIAEFTESELWTVRSTLKERYGSSVEPELADCELHLDPASPKLTSCPSLFWQQDKCNFVLFKVGEARFRCQFFYAIDEMFGTGIEEYDNIGDCVLTVLQVQADSDAERKGNLPHRS